MKRAFNELPRWVADASAPYDPGERARLRLSEVTEDAKA